MSDTKFVFDSALRLSTHLPCNERIDIILSLFKTLSKSDQMQCFNKLAYNKELLVDSLLMGLNQQVNPVQQKTRTVPAVLPELEPGEIRQSSVSEPSASVIDEFLETCKKNVTTTVKTEPKSFKRRMIDQYNDDFINKPVKRVKFEEDVKTSVKYYKIKANNFKEVEYHLNDGKILCAFQNQCVIKYCEDIHLTHKFICLNYGNCKCSMKHLSDLPVPKYYHRNVTVVRSQFEYDNECKRGMYSCGGGMYCYRQCKYLHIKQGYQCLKTSCYDEKCKNVHVKYCTNYKRDGYCNKWNHGVCGKIHPKQ